jgi:hypothetical protein
MTEFNLSEKECNILINKIDLNKILQFEKGFFTEDVKEFIRLLKDVCRSKWLRSEEELEEIDKLAGKSLI